LIVEGNCSFADEPFSVGVLLLGRDLLSHMHVSLVIEFDVVLMALG